MDLRETGWGGCELVSTGSGQGPLASCCECGDESSGSCTTELVRYMAYHCVLTGKRDLTFINIKPISHSIYYSGL
jgi:hypothetical protein